MRLRTLILSFSLLASLSVVFVPSASAANVTFSQTFTQNTTPNSSIVTAWQGFRSGLTGSYASFSWSSSNGASITVSDPSKVQILANALRLGTATSTTIGSNTWYVGVGCGPASAVEFSNQGTCSCTAGYNIRPQIGNVNWGGSNGTTCGAATQTITITFYDSAPDTTAPTFTSSSSFSAAENISISTAAATIKVSESATVTISSGADAALFTISNSDTVTALIKFKASPNYESPSDSGGNNVYDLVLTARDSASNSGTQTISITVTDVVDTSSFNSFALAGGASAATYRSAIQINASVTTASKVTFRAANVVIAGCKGKLATGSGTTYTVSCSWKPAKRGSITLSAISTPTNIAISGATAAPITVSVVNRSTPR